MSPARERHLVGPDALDAATTLLQLVRRAHPTFGLYEAADLQWWSRVPRSTDAVPQLFWFDGTDPVAAAILTDWGDRIALDPILRPEAAPEWVAHVVERGLAHARDSGFEAVGVEIDRADDGMRSVLAGHGFSVEDDGVVESWLASDARPPVSPLADGYRLCARLDTGDRLHHFAARSGPGVEARLQRTSLYRPDLDLLVLGPDDDVAAYGLFWSDPVTGTGLVEPMRTEDEHQRRGLARHILTTGLDRLAAAGATRIKICFEPANAAAKHLYLDVGFVPDRETAVLRRPLAERRFTAAGDPERATL
jgi:GNAT superfamily N-acetyltransferase